MYHKTLLRQLVKQFGSEYLIPGGLERLFDDISEVYRHADEDRRLIERSLDISSRELGDLNLQFRAERDRANAIILSIVDGLIVVNKDFNIELINPQAEKMLDIEPGKSRGKKLFNFGKLFINDKPLMPEEGFVARTMKSKNALTSSLEDNLYVLAASGKKFPVVVTTTPLMMPGTKDVYGVLLIFRDVAREKQQHSQVEYEVIKRTQELFLEKNKLSLTLASITDAVITVDLDNRIVVFNKSAENLLGIPSSSAMGKKLNDVISVYENKSEIFPERYIPEHDNSSEGIVYAGDSLKVVCGGREVYVSLVSSHITDDQKVNKGYIISMHDVSEEKMLDDMKIDFVSMAAHELRTPLTVIRGYASMLQDDASDNLTEQQRLSMDRMMISIDNLANLINNLLNVSRIEHGLLKLNLAEADIAGVIQEAVNGLENSAKIKNQKLEFVKEKADFPSLLIDHFRIGEVITNLIGNAITYTKPGGEITVRLEQKDNSVVVSVIDTGEGIPKDALPKLFTKFFRVSGVLEQGSKGTGLGLYISKSIIELHKGQIGVESEIGKGSKFYFILPIPTEEEKNKTMISLPGKEGFGIIMNTERQKKLLRKSEE
jgi:PAS domain S-box-containing protein